MWRREIGVLLGTFCGHDADLLCLSGSQGGIHAVPGEHYYNAIVWNLTEVATGAGSGTGSGSGGLVVLEGHDDYVYGVAITPDGTQVVTIFN